MIIIDLLITYKI